KVTNTPTFSPNSPLRPKCKLDRRSHVGLRPWREERNLPLFVLHECRNAKARPKKEICICRGVILSSTPRQIAPINLPVPQLNSKLTLCIEPVVAANLLSLGRPTKLGANQLVIVCPGVEIRKVLVKTAVTPREIWWRSRSSFNPQIKFL